MSCIDFINNFYQAIIDKRVDNIINSYQDSEEVYVILEGPRLSTKGITKIAQGWRDFCNSSIQLLSINWVDGPYVFETPHCSSLIGIILMKVEINGKAFEITFRASFVLSIEDGAYRIIHEHVSGALSDPYGIGDWKKYYVHDKK